MAVLSTSNHWAFAFGLLGNVISFIVFLAPVPTFYRIWKKKSTEGFHSVPYVVALFSAMLWLYYATQKKDVFLLVTINCFGCFIETIYIAIFITFAHKKARMHTLRLLLLLNFGGFCVILLVCQFLTRGSTRVKVLGGICVGFAVSVFAAPLSIIRVVIKTKSVEFMPFSLSFFLTMSAIAWLAYGVSLKDFYIAFPNLFGFILGMIQMILYVVYKYCYKPVPTIEKDGKMQEHSIDIVKFGTAARPEVEAPPPVAPPVTCKCGARITTTNDIEGGGQGARNAAKETAGAS